MSDVSKQDALRTLRTDSDDPRVVRTRQKLIDAYRRLADASPGASISVTAIAREAGVTRSSFYAHFSDASELAALALTEFQDAAGDLARAAVLAGGSKTEVNTRALLGIVRFLDERRDTYRPLLVSGGAYVDAISDVFVRQVLVTLGTRETLHGDPEVTARFLTGGLMRVLAWWLDSDPRLAPEDLTAAIIAIAPPDFVD